jgi:hypothetical protein
MAKGNWYNYSNDTCPPKCCPFASEECHKRMDNTGHVIIPDEEVMLVFGGLTYRNKNFLDNTTILFDECENYETLTGDTSLPDSFKNCGEELLNDIWMYHLN